MVGYDVSVKEIAAEHLTSVRGKYSTSVLPLVVPRELSRVADALRAQCITPTGGAVALYHGVDGDTVDVELGYPVHVAYSPTDPSSEVSAGAVPAGRVVHAVHVGPYDAISKAYEALMAYADSEGLTLGGPMWERYVTDPSLEQDPGKYVTEIYWRVV